MRRLKTTALAFLALAGSALAAEAQILVYDLGFHKLSGINFSPYTGGYFVVEATGGTGSFILTLSDQRIFDFSEDSGEMFIGIKRGESRAVLRATGTVGTSQVAYLAHGEIDGSITAAPEFFVQKIRTASGSEPPRRTGVLTPVQVDARPPMMSCQDSSEHSLRWGSPPSMQSKPMAAMSSSTGSIPVTTR